MRCFFGLLLPLIPILSASAVDVSELRAHVQDDAAIISPGLEADLERLLADHEAETTNWIAILTVETLGGADLEAFSQRVATARGQGRTDRYNAVLLFVSRREGRIRIEVGRGLESELTDLRTGEIIREIIQPAVRDGRPEAGIRAGVHAIVETLAKRSRVPVERETAGDAETPWGLRILFFVLVLPLLQGATSFYLNRFRIPFAVLAGFAFVLFESAVGTTVGITIFVIYAAALLAFSIGWQGTERGRGFVTRWNALVPVAALWPSSRRTGDWRSSDDDPWGRCRSNPTGNSSPRRR